MPWYEKMFLGINVENKYTSGTLVGIVKSRGTIDRAMAHQAKLILVWYMLLELEKPQIISQTCLPQG